jgi:glucose/arabinose dehydrogenase
MRHLPSFRLSLAILVATTSGVAVLDAQQEIIRGELPPMPEVRYVPEPEGVRVETVATGLEAVWTLQFAPDGRLFLTERPGRVRIIERDGTLRPEPWFSVEDRVLHVGESGLMGLALHPDFPREPWVYLMYTMVKPGGQAINRVVRVREAEGRGVEEQVLIDDIAAQQGRANHSGGTLRFGPDGMLYIATGDIFEGGRSEDLGDLAGSVLRVRPDGGIPSDNPIGGSPIWVYGVRNVHGLAWQPGTGRVFAGDHGPTGEDGARHHDRLIVLEPGRHHGWPRMIGAPGLPEYVDPILTFVPASPPGDVLFYEGELFPQFRGDLFYSVLGFQPAGAQTLLRVRFEDPANPTRPTSQERWFNDAEGNSRYGRLRALTVGPDGAIYVGTSNRDGRQLSRERITAEDDRVLRLVPR